MLKKTLMIVGIGDLAGLVLDMITTVPSFGKIILAGRDVNHMNQRANLCRLVANQLGYYPEIECVSLDLMNVEQTSNTLLRCKPDIIFNTASLQSWRILTLLPKEVYESLDQAQFGPWLPMHLTTIYKLMLAVKAAGLDADVINAAFPDATAPVLDKVGLSPMCGIGNVANVIPALRGSVANKFQLPVQRVEVSLVTQHYFSHRVPAFGDSGGSPYYFRALIDGEELSDGYTDEEIFRSVATDFKKTGGPFRQMITASSAVSLLVPLMLGHEARTHAPGPHGLVGGYPVVVGSDGVEVDLPKDLSLADAVRINQECQRFDGIESIDDDGTVHFTEHEVSIMKKFLGYECHEMPLSDCEERAEELRAKYVQFAASFRKG
ncbi:hypothetical protein OAO01_06310 [Oligoflexia bacterium]|nr:hypothetical protein [Oligoflexia bacterium]